jgi:hypothetical protein
VVALAASNVEGSRQISLDPPIGSWADGPGGCGR